MSNNNQHRHPGYHNRSGEPSRYHDAWDHLTPPSSPGRREREMNNNTYRYGEYGHWSYGRSNPSARYHNYDNDNVRTGHQNDQRWTNQQYLYDPFEPLPIGSPRYKPDYEEDRYLAEQQHAHQSRKRNLDTAADYREMSNYLSNEEARHRNSYPIKGNKPEHIYSSNKPYEPLKEGLAFCPPKARKKRPKGMPKRPLSAYNLFFQSERIKIIEESSTPLKNDEKEKDSEITLEKPHASSGNPVDKTKDNKAKKTRSKRTPHGKISFEKLGRLIGARWKELPEAEKKQYQDRAGEESQRYSSEMDEYHKKNLEIHSKEKVELNENKDIQRNKEDNKSSSNQVLSVSFSSNNNKYPNEASSSEKLDVKETSDAKEVGSMKGSSITWKSVPPPEWNRDIRVTVEGEDGKAKEYFLAYAAVQMTKECAMNYISTLSNIFPVKPNK